MDYNFASTAMKNDKSLRVITTARSLKNINEAAQNGFWPLVKPVIPSPDVQNMLAVFQHNTTGEIVISKDLRHSFGAEYTLVIPYMDYYPYHFREPYAAYLLPADLSEGEHVWLDDVIEDIVAVFGNQGYYPRLEKAEAVWENGDFRVLFDPEKGASVWIG